MKQGKAQHSGSASTKVEPRSQRINPAAVSEIGVHQMRTKSQPMYEGRGLHAPMKGQTNHTRGSQGKH